MRSIILHFCALLVGCTAAQVPVNIDGRQLCVPKSHLIPRVAWIKPDGRSVRDNGGIAVKNCLLTLLPDKRLVQSKCLFPPEIGSVAIDPNDGKRMGIGSLGFQDTLMGRISNAKDTRWFESDHGKLLVMENQRLWGDWYIVHRGDNRPNQNRYSLSPSDELIAECHAMRSRVGAPPGQFRNTFECNRNFSTGGLALLYSFEPTLKVPKLSDIDGLDRQLAVGVDRMECK